jgi:hypothetical protein
VADRLARHGRSAGPLLDGSQRTTDLIIGEQKLRVFLQEIRDLRLRCGQQDDLTTDPEYFIAANALRFRRVAAVLIRRIANSRPVSSLLSTASWVWASAY